MPDRTSDRAKRWTLVAAIIVSGTVFLNGSVVTVALPAIGRGLETGLSGLQWVIDAYTLTLASLLILGGALGDRLGRRRVGLVGLAGFGVTLLACGLAPTLSWLTAMRALQGLFGALLVPISLALIRAVYTDPKERGCAIGTWSGWSGVSTVIGPLLGGWLVDTLSWRWAFFVGLPLSLFRSRNFSGVNLTTLAVYAALYGSNFLLVLYIQSVMGYTALQAGLLTAPISLLLLLLSTRFGALAGRYGPRLFLTVDLPPIAGAKIGNSRAPNDTQRFC